MTYNNRGQTYYQQGKYDLAIRDYTTAIKLDPRLGLAYNNRGIAYRKLGKPTLAAADFASAKKWSFGSQRSPIERIISAVLSHL